MALKGVTYGDKPAENSHQEMNVSSYDQKVQSFCYSDTGNKLGLSAQSLMWG